MSSFNAPLICQDSENGKYRRVYLPFSYEIGSLGSGRLITVPKGFITDGASIPQMFWGLGLSPWGDYSKSAVLHDWMYASQIVTRLEADNIFLESMDALGISEIKANLMFKMVRWFAGSAWKKHKRLGHPLMIATGGFPTYSDAKFLVAE